MTETVFEVWSAAYTRSALETGMSGRPNGACCANACCANAPDSRNKTDKKQRIFISAPWSREKQIPSTAIWQIRGRCYKMGLVSDISPQIMTDRAVFRWDEKAGLPRYAIRSQCSTCSR